MRRMGIYLIQNIETGERYVGSSRDVFHRRDQHFSELRKGIHLNKRLQTSFSDYSEDRFIFTVIEDVGNKDDLVFREQYWLDTILPEFNILKTANNNSITRTEFLVEKYKRHGELMRGRKASEETKKKMSKSHLERYKNPNAHIKLTKEQREHLREKNLGENNPNWGLHRSNETKKIMSEKMAKIIYTFLSPTGDTVSVRNLSNGGAESIGLNYHSARKLYQGKIKSCKGWTFVKSEKIRRIR
jgi:group I intron endonuclease